MFNFHHITIKSYFKGENIVIVENFFRFRGKRKLLFLKFVS